MKFLIVEDNFDDLELTERTLRSGFDSVQCVEVASETGFRQAIETNGYDVVLTDYRLAWTTGTEVLTKIKRRWPGLPVIMMTESGDEQGGRRHEGGPERLCI